MLSSGDEAMGADEPLWNKGLSRSPSIMSNRIKYEAVTENTLEKLTVLSYVI